MAVRVTACDACGRTDEMERPVGWVIVAVVLEEQEEEVDGIIVRYMGGRNHTRNKQRCYTLCSVGCLAAFVEMEAARMDGEICGDPGDARRIARGDA